MKQHFLGQKFIQIWRKLYPEWYVKKPYLMSNLHHFLIQYLFYFSGIRFGSRNHCPRSRIQSRHFRLTRLGCRSLFYRRLPGGWRLFPSTRDNILGTRVPMWSLHCNNQCHTHEYRLSADEYSRNCIAITPNFRSPIFWILFAFRRGGGEWFGAEKYAQCAFVNYVFQVQFKGISADFVIDWYVGL